MRGNPKSSPTPPPAAPCRDEARIAQLPRRRQQILAGLPPTGDRGNVIEDVTCALRNARVASTIVRSKLGADGDDDDGAKRPGSNPD